MRDAGCAQAGTPPSVFIPFIHPTLETCRCAAPRLDPNMEFAVTSKRQSSDAVLASRVRGTAVYNTRGEHIGRVEDVILDSRSDRIVYVALGLGVLFGLCSKFLPIPWTALYYSSTRDGYIVTLPDEDLKAAPTYDLADLIGAGA
jgi:sporulation protein YlmC with PRC-barrel domain